MTGPERGRYLVTSDVGFRATGAPSSANSEESRLISPGAGRNGCDFLKVGPAEGCGRVGDSAPPEDMSFLLNTHLVTHATLLDCYASTRMPDMYSVILNSGIKSSSVVRALLTALKFRGIMAATSANPSCKYKSCVYSNAGLRAGHAKVYWRRIRPRPPRPPWRPMNCVKEDSRGSGGCLQYVGERRQQGYRGRPRSKWLTSASACF
jgi:hypothetical protein